jgi:hypothetical protein
MAEMPPPGVRGSKKATLKSVAGAACTVAASGAGDPSARLKSFAESCNRAAKLGAKGSVFAGSVGEGDPHKEHAFHVEANHCYRVYAAFEATDAIVALRDSAGDTVSESPSGASPDTGASCFRVADDVTVVVSAGTGKGRYAAQVWGD